MKLKASKIVDAATQLSLSLGFDVNNGQALVG